MYVHGHGHGYDGVNTHLLKILSVQNVIMLVINCGFIFQFTHIKNLYSLPNIFSINKFEMIVLFSYPFFYSLLIVNEVLILCTNLSGAQEFCFPVP